MLTALAFGFRHGIDWDHLAAISDIAGSQSRPRRSMVLSTLYALGHALAVLVLGVLAIALSEQLPNRANAAMERLIGATLIALAAYVVIGLVRHGRDFRLRSRWMLVGAGVRRVVRWLTGQDRTRPEVVIEHEHEHEHAPDREHGHEHRHEHAAARVGAGPTAPRHGHRHRHVVVMPDDPFPSYGPLAAVGVGLLHGIGAETPTQVVVFVTAAGLAGSALGVLLLLCFIAGLLISNTVVALAATFGFLNAARNFTVYAAVSLMTAVVSLAIGTIFLLGGARVLPAILGG